MLGDGGMLMITGVASVGNGTDTLHYAYRPGLSQLETATWRNSQDAVLNSRTYAYDVYHRLTGINLNNISEVAYTLNDKDQRTAVSYAVGGAWNYSYDDKSQVTGASGNNTVFSYAYDGIGNRVTAAEGSDTWSYTSNLLNQYTAINSNQPTYDADGNMLTTGDGWLYTWNGENRLIRAENSDTLVEMAYDYMGRRVEKKVSSKGLLSFYNWNVDKHYKFAYDDYKLIAVYDATNNNALLMTFTWQPESVGLDVPVSITYDGNTYYYVTDGNKNVTGLLDQAGNRVAEYVYGPFGQLLGAEGELAEVNPFRFSSEFHDDETGLVYYNYRYYNAKLGRWIKRDPIEEQGGINLYVMLLNNILGQWDNLGFVVKKICSNGTCDVKERFGFHNPDVFEEAETQASTRKIVRGEPIKRTRNYKITATFECRIEVRFVASNRSAVFDTTWGHEQQHVNLGEKNYRIIIQKFSTVNGKIVCGYPCAKAYVDMLNAFAELYKINSAYENENFDCQDYKEPIAKRAACQRAKARQKDRAKAILEYNKFNKIVDEKCSGK